MLLEERVRRVSEIMMSSVDKDSRKVHLCVCLCLCVCVCVCQREGEREMGEEGVRVRDHDVVR